MGGILNHYIEGNPDSKYVFPILKRNTPVLKEGDGQLARKHYNQGLKVIAQMCGIEQTLTSYVSRHSFATQAMLLNIPINVHIPVKVSHHSD